MKKYFEVDIKLKATGNKCFFAAKDIEDANKILDSIRSMRDLAYLINLTSDLDISEIDFLWLKEK